jgi:hypothetical protein
MFNVYDIPVFFLPFPTSSYPLSLTFALVFFTQYDFNSSRHRRCLPFRFSSALSPDDRLKKILLLMLLQGKEMSKMRRVLCHTIMKFSLFFLCSFHRHDDDNDDDDEEDEVER